MFSYEYCEILKNRFFIEHSCGYFLRLVVLIDKYTIWKNFNQ